MSGSEKLGVIFDMDGVLVDSNLPHFEAFQVMAQRLGKPFTRELWERSIGMHNNSIFPMWLGEGLTPERIQELADEKEALYREQAGSSLKAVDGVHELLEVLKRHGGFKLAVGSSGPRQNVALAIKILGAEKVFDTVVTGHDVKHGKPAPDIFLKAGQGLGLEPSRCLVIEDAPQGIKAAIAAKMRVVGLTTSKPAKELYEATVVVNSLRELTPARISEILLARS